MEYTPIQMIGTIIFAIAVIHTFIVGKFQSMAHHYPEGSIGENIFHFLGEVEAVFGMWAAIFIGFYTYLHGLNEGAVHYLEHEVHFTEPVFVFVIMCLAATRPVVLLAEKIIFLVARLMPFNEKFSFFISALVLGPLLGSFITEPAAMTVTAMILLNYFYQYKMSEKFKYATVGLLFVNVSVGGTLTHFAAPPVLMVAAKFNWDTLFMMTHLGYKAAIAIVISTFAVAFYFKKELSGKVEHGEKSTKMLPPLWITMAHLIFLAAVVYTSHHMVVFLGVFLFFLGFIKVTAEYQEEVKLKEALMVGFFFGGLVVLGGQQGWWLSIVLQKMSDLTLFFGATALTGITDNAALTYLGSLVPGLTDSQKYNLVAGAVTGGGLTVIANAPNPAGYGILKASFEGQDIKPLGLFLSALIPTFIVIVCMQLLR